MRTCPQPYGIFYEHCVVYYYYYYATDRSVVIIIIIITLHIVYSNVRSRPYVYSVGTGFDTRTDDDDDDTVQGYRCNKFFMLSPGSADP